MARSRVADMRNNKFISLLSVACNHLPFINVLLRKLYGFPYEILSDTVIHRLFKL